MREEKSDEPIPLEPVRLVAQELNPNELLIEGQIEIRPCALCRTRLTSPITFLGREIACPRCGCTARALAAAGPFADLDPNKPRMARPEPPIPLQSVDPSVEPIVPVLAPVTPYRREDPIDDRSPMVDTVARLQWIAGVFLLAVAVMQLGTFWKREHATESEELATYLTAAVRCVLAGALIASSSAVDSRSRAGWWIGLGLSILISAGTIYVWTDQFRVPGYRGRYDYAVLLEMPPFLISVFTLVILITPRYRAEFAQPSTV